MAERITSGVLERKLQRLKKLLPDGVQPVLDATNNGYRLEFPEGSPWFPSYLGRLRPREMERAIEAMTTLLEYQLYRHGGYENE